MSEEQAELELRAYLALQGASGAAGKPGDWRIDVAAALRSSDPLSTEFRDMLASFVDGGRFRLELVADNGEKKRRQDWFGGVIVRREWMEIGEWMDNAIVSGYSRANAISAAADKFAASREKCDGALVYYKRATSWVDIAINKGDDLAKLMSREQFLSLFHDRDARGRALDR